MTTSKRDEAWQHGCSDASANEVQYSTSGRRRVGIDCTPMEQFLLETLRSKLHMHQRGDATFFTLRAWRKPIKEWQIAALIAAKEFPSRDFVSRIANEVISAASTIHGRHGIRNVIPVPPGNSGISNSLSIQVAKLIAEELDANFANVLVGQDGRGGSHPKKSAILKPYRLSSQVTGTSLLVDDVVSTGRHMQLALKALRSIEAPTLSFAWIGSTDNAAGR